MDYKITIFGACAPYPRLIIKSGNEEELTCFNKYRETILHRLSRKERMMTSHQNPGPDHYNLKQKGTENYVGFDLDRITDS